MYQRQKISHPAELITKRRNMAVNSFQIQMALRKQVVTMAIPGKPITEIITNGFFTVDRKWTVKYWNKAAEILLGVKAKDIVGKNLWEEFAGIIPLNFYAVYHKAFLQDIPVHFEEYWGEMGAWFDVITYHCDDTLSVSFKSSNQPTHPDYAKHAAASCTATKDSERTIPVCNRSYQRLSLGMGPPGQGDVLDRWRP